MVLWLINRLDGCIFLMAGWFEGWMVEYLKVGWLDGWMLDGWILDGLKVGW